MLNKLKMNYSSIYYLKFKYLIIIYIYSIINVVCPKYYMNVNEIDKNLSCQLKNNLSLVELRNLKK